MGGLVKFRYIDRRASANTSQAVSIAAFSWAVEMKFPSYLDGGI